MLKPFMTAEQVREDGAGSKNANDQSPSNPFTLWLFSDILMLTFSSTMAIFRHFLTILCETFLADGIKYVTHLCQRSPGIKHLNSSPSMQDSLILIHRFSEMLS